jgi:hypothetical protein
MNDILIDCSFKSYSTGPKFDQFIQRYAILSRAILHSTGPHMFVFVQILYKKSPVLCGISREHTYSFFSRELAKIFENILGHESGTYLGLFDE